MTPTDLATLARHAVRCVSHHHACDCREYEHAQEVERLRGLLHEASLLPAIYCTSLYRRIIAALGEVKP